MFYIYVICILFATLPMLCNSVASQKTTTAGDSNDMDAVLQRSIDLQVQAETKYERVFQYCAEQGKIQRKQARERAEQEQAVDRERALHRERAWKQALERARIAAREEQLLERQLRGLCHQLSSLRITKVRWAEPVQYLYFEPENCSESEVSTEVDDYLEQSEVSTEVDDY